MVKKEHLGIGNNLREFVVLGQFVFRGSKVRSQGNLDGICVFIVLYVGVIGAADVDGCLQKPLSCHLSQNFPNAVLLPSFSKYDFPTQDNHILRNVANVV